MHDWLAGAAGLRCNRGWPLVVKPQEMPWAKVIIATLDADAGTTRAFATFLVGGAGRGFAQTTMQPLLMCLDTVLCQVALQTTSQGLFTLWPRPEAVSVSFLREPAPSQSSLL